MFAPPTPLHAAASRSLTVLAAVLAGLAMLLATGAAFAGSYRLGPQDILKINVVEWRAGQNEYFIWEAMRDEYAVNADGAVALPLLGEVPAAGLTTAELAAAIADSLQKRANLVSRPDVSVEVATYRPVYVVGQVQNPGEYAYRPELTVLQAVGIAGGLQRVTETGLIRLERERIATLGDYETARLDLRRMLVRRARLEAELQDSETIEVPDELSTDSGVDRLLQEEYSVMTARNDALQSQLVALADLKNLYEREVLSLADKTNSQEKQVELAHRELGGVNTLVEKGLAVNSRQFALERLVADLESRKIDLDTALLRARQEIRRAERDAVDLQKERKSTVATELQETRAEIDQLNAKLSTLAALIDEIAYTAPRLVLEREAATRSIPHYTIVRSTDGVSGEIAADETTRVDPGDVVRIELHAFAPDGSTRDSSSTRRVAPGSSAQAPSQ